VELVNASQTVDVMPLMFLQCLNLHRMWMSPLILSSAVKLEMQFQTYALCMRTKPAFVGASESVQATTKTVPRTVPSKSTYISNLLNPLDAINVLLCD
jgi:hypothetical protein